MGECDVSFLRWAGTASMCGPRSGLRPYVWGGKYSQYGVDMPRQPQRAMTCLRRILIR